MESDSPGRLADYPQHVIGDSNDANGGGGLTRAALGSPAERASHGGGGGK